MSDRELLELAAKAVGGIVYIEDLGFIFEDEYGNRGPWWNPLGNDGDALRLAVKLNLHVLEGIAQDGEGRIFCDKSPDPYAATRRAIVRAAAEIGRAMP